MYTSVKGTEEYLFDDAVIFRSIENKARRLFTLYGYSEIILPALEPLNVFLRGVGGTSDIVTRQMFRIHQKEDIVLRPEGTSQVVRSYIQNSLDKKKEFVKFFYLGAMYRGENPQKGRLREFHHIGLEVLGSGSPYVDAEVISLGEYFLKQELGITDFTLQINSIGCSADKERFSGLVKRKGEALAGRLCGACRTRLQENPLRVLDCKNPECKKNIAAVRVNAQDYLCSACMTNFQRVQEVLNRVNVRYEIKDTLVRGLDYYTGIVFEFVTASLGTQDALGAGGRYDGLVAQLGGTQTPACGCAFGVERLMLMLKKTAEVPVSVSEKVFCAPLDAASSQKAFELAALLRKNGIPADMDYTGRSLKSQLRYSQKNNVTIVIIIGEEERTSGIYTVKNMKTSEQIKVPEAELAAKVKEILTT